MIAGTEILAWLSRFGALVGAERDPERVVQRVTDEATTLLGAQFGSFFYNVVDAAGESSMPFALAGASRDDFEKLGMPRNTAIFGPTFAGEETVRIDDVTQDSRYGKNPPHRGMPAGHLPVRSYLAAPVKTPSGEVLGGLFFGHPEVAVFGEADARALAALATVAGTALENARLFVQLRDREAQLRSSELRYRLVADAMQEGIWFWDVLANRIEWNDRLLEILGVARETWGGSPDRWAELLHAEDRPVLDAALKAHFEERVPYRPPPFRLRHADGSYRWCTTAGQAEWDETGRPMRMAGSIRDITDRKLAEDRLRENELRFSQILDSIEDMVFTKNDRLQVTWANAATCRYYGATLDALRGLTDVAASPLELTLQYNQDDRAVFETGEAIERTEEQNVAPDGQIHVFHTVKTPLRDGAARVVELVGVSRDVTARKREADAQRLLAEASAILGASIDYEQTLVNLARATVPDFADWAAVDMLAPTGGLRRLAVHHRDPAKIAFAHELESKYPTDMTAPTGVPQVLRTQKIEWLADIPDALLVAGTRDAEHLAIARALGLRSYIVAPLVIGAISVGAISFVSAESGRRYGPDDVAFVSELARRASVAVENARLYGRVRELADTLERRVAARTESLREANRELEAFSYTVSHDLRAPVRHISGFADLLRAHAGDLLDAKSARYVDTIKSAASQMGALIDGLLAFSRLGRAPVEKRPVALDELVREVIRELEPETLGRTIRWRIDDLPAVSADRTMIRTVVANLLHNAVKYTRLVPEAHVTVEARREGGHTVVSVTDDGVGFNMQYAHKLFGVFQRLHADKDFEGTGIGLATVRRIVAKHGGRTWAQAGEHGGATFSFSLPIDSPPLEPLPLEEGTP